MAPRTAVVVGNPKPGSRTLAAAVHLARELSDPQDLGLRALDPGEGKEAGAFRGEETAAVDVVVDLATLGPALLDWGSTEVSTLVEQVGSADLVVVASPTYKATYTGLLKVFLDRFAGGTGLRGVAVPLMLGGGPAHALAPELHLRPLLVELGGTVATPSLYLLDREHDQPTAYADWLAAARPTVSALLGARTTTGGRP